MTTINTLLALSLLLNLVLALQWHKTAAGRTRIHNSFRNVSRINGKCQCPYCRGDAEDLAELAADYELQLWTANKKLEALK